MELVCGQCAGNRRTAMSKVRTVRGVGWDISAIGNGMLLSDEFTVCILFIFLTVYHLNLLGRYDAT